MADLKKVTREELDTYIEEHKEDETLDVSVFDVSEITEMGGLFDDCECKQVIGLENWDTSNVTDMCAMFTGCSNLKELNVSNFDTSNVTDMTGMFLGCEALSTLDLSKFDVSNVKNAEFMFDLCEKLPGSVKSNFELRLKKTKNKKSASSDSAPFKSTYINPIDEAIKLASDNRLRKKEIEEIQKDPEKYVSNDDWSDWTDERSGFRCIKCDCYWGASFRDSSDWECECPDGFKRENIKEVCEDWPLMSFVERESAQTKFAFVCCYLNTEYFFHDYEYARDEDEAKAYYDAIVANPLD